MNEQIKGGALTGKRAIVIGGGSGIGFGIARAFARDGAHVTIAGRTESKLAAAAAELVELPGEVAWVRCDALVGADVRAAVETAGDEEGRLHLAAVVPGAHAFSSILDFEDDDFAEDVRKNVQPVFLTLKYAGRAMVRAGGGSFVAISSVIAGVTGRKLASYTAGKTAVDAMVRVAAEELGEFDVRVNSVRPSFTVTPIARESMEDGRIPDLFLEATPIRRLGAVDDIANAVRFLAGPESSWITGQHLSVDGGLPLRWFPNHDGLDQIPSSAKVR